MRKLSFKYLVQWAIVCATLHPSTFVMSPELPSRHLDPESSAEKFLLQPVEPRMSHFFGGICILCGLALASLVIWFSFAALGRGLTTIGPYVFLIIVGALSGLMLSFGYRLLARRPNRYGSLLSPATWFVFALLFLFIGAGGLIVSLMGRDFRHLDGVFGALLFSLLSYGAGSHFMRKTTK